MVRRALTSRRLGWITAAGIVAAVGWVFFAGDSSPHDVVLLPPPYQPPETARPTLRMLARLPVDGTRILAKPVIAADRDGRVVVVAMCTTVGGMQLLRWRSVDRGQTWAGPVVFENWPTGADFAADPWLVTDHRGRFHLIHLATGLKDRRVCPAVYRQSSDGGATWAAPVRIADSVDRPVLAISPDGRRLAAVMMMVDPDAAPLTPADVVDGSITVAASNRLQTAGIFRSDDGGANWKRLPGPAAVRHAVPFSTAIDDAGRVAAGWVVNDGRGSYSMIGTTADGGAKWTEAVVARSLQPGRPHPFNGGRFPIVVHNGSGQLQALFVEAGGVGVSAQVSRDWVRWSPPTHLSAYPVAEVRFPALAAAGDAIHATWMARVGDQRYEMRHRASKDGGTRWSEPLILTVTGQEPPAGPGFRIVSDDDQTAVAVDRCGLAHVVWPVRGSTPGQYTVHHAVIDWQIPGP